MNENVFGWGRCRKAWYMKQQFKQAVFMPIDKALCIQICSVFQRFKISLIMVFAGTVF